MLPKLHLNDLRLRVFCISIESCNSSLHADGVFQKDSGRGGIYAHQGARSGLRGNPVNLPLEVLRFFVPAKLRYFCNQSWKHLFVPAFPDVNHTQNLNIDNGAGKFSRAQNGISFALAGGS